MEDIYHFTCTARLPWIIASGELRPGRNQIGKFPDPDFLWATTCREGDRTASGMLGYRKGISALVRRTLHAEDFELWPAIVARFPQWTPDQVRRLEAAARRKGETKVSCWRARTDPLPLTRVIAAEAKTYIGNWQSVELRCIQHPIDPSLRGIEFCGSVYCSMQRIKSGHATQYITSKMLLSEFREVNHEP
jgi:hypothetical protein